VTIQGRQTLFFSYTPLPWGEPYVPLPLLPLPNCPHVSKDRQPLTECISDPTEQKQGARSSWHDPRRIKWKLFWPVSLLAFFPFFLFLWLMGRSPSLVGLATNSALRFFSLSSLCGIRYKENGPDQASNPVIFDNLTIHSTELSPNENDSQLGGGQDCNPSPELGFSFKRRPLIWHRASLSHQRRQEGTRRQRSFSSRLKREGKSGICHSSGCRARDRSH
jgi:hypothetical protein